MAEHSKTLGMLTFIFAIAASLLVVLGILVFYGYLTSVQVGGYSYTNLIAFGVIFIVAAVACAWGEREGY